VIRVQGIDHVAINVKDLNQSLEFYTQVLGLSVTQREDSKPGVEYFLDCGSSLLGLIQGEEAKGVHPLGDQGVGGNHVSFRAKTQDFDRIVEELKQRKIPITLMKKREKSWSVYFRDPDGNKLEITAWPLEDQSKNEGESKDGTQRRSESAGI
jgi:catechol 2,3-dioxygenase-like lactoylglutathione lyase family enzyme